MNRESNHITRRDIRIGKWWVSRRLLRDMLIVFGMPLLFVVIIWVFYTLIDYDHSIRDMREQQAPSILLD